jgi:hypothetical protein
MKRTILIVILAVVALNAFGGAWYGVMGARSVPREWLRGSPFSDYIIPSIVLGLVVGGSCLVALIAQILRRRSANGLALVAGVVLVCWITIQLAFIGYVSPLQPIMATVGVSILVLAGLLKQVVL